jgi:hypothetical protein
MAIDFVIDYDCVPKQTLGTEGILQRIKGKARAEAVIALFRENGDYRPPQEMGFEFTRASADGSEEVQIIVVQHLLDEAAELEPLAQHCIGCPANRNGQPFGCMGQIEYPITLEAEAWLLNQLPNIEEPLIWLLLRQGIDEFDYDGSDVAPLRANEGVYFTERKVLGRGLGEFIVNADQVFEMLFLLGHIQPSHAGVLLLFFHVVQRDMEANEVMQISRAPEASSKRYPFLLKPAPDDDRSISNFKDFFWALYLAWSLNTRLLVDA